MSSIKITKGNTGGIESTMNDRIDRHENTIYAVILFMLFMLAGFLIDYFRFNSTVYKEYSQKTESVEVTQKINQELLDQNKKNQEVIIELQKQLIKK
jgi:hypothetical protein